MKRQFRIFLDLSGFRPVRFTTFMDPKLKSMKPIHLLKSLLIPSFYLLSAYASAQPSINGYNVYYGSLHNHSNVSDGQGTPAEAYNYAKNTAHLDFFGLADHSTFMTSSQYTSIKNAANTYNENNVFAAFYGFEWTSFGSYGHVAVINTDDFCTSITTTTFSGLLSWVNARTGIAFFNHPGWETTATKEFNHFTNTPSDKFVGMELWNDHDGFSKYYYNDGYYSNDGNKGYYDEALIRGWKTGAAGADDNHTATWGTATDFRVGVLATSLSRTEILNAFKARRFFSTTDKNISLSFRINGSEMGSTVTGGTWSPVMEAVDGDGESFTEVALMKNGVQVGYWTNVGSHPMFTTSGPITCANGDYLYFRVKQTDGGEAISSPIFISGSANQPPVVAISSPVNGATFNEGETIVISATASDPDGTVSKVEFYQGTTKLGESTVSPYQYSWINVPAGSYSLTAKAHDNLGAITTSAAVNITVSAVQTPIIAESRILYGKDDAEEYAKGTVILNSDDIDLVYDSKTTGNQTVGLLFRNLAIPQGANISKAYIQFTTNKVTTASCSLTIKGQAADNAADFTSKARNLSSLIRTTASAAWSPDPWNTTGTSGSAQQTPDIKTIVQEIINRQGWTTTSNLAITITGTGTRTAYSYESSSAMAAIIHVEYIPAPGSPLASNNDDMVTLKNQLFEDEPVISANGVSVYPNPVTDKLNIRTANELKVQLVRIYSMTGRLVSEIRPVDTQVETQIDCSAIPAGTYLLHIRTDKGNYPVRFIRQ